MSRILPAVARNSHRMNSQSSAPRSLVGKTSIQIRQILEAGKSIQLHGSGDKFHYIGGTGPLQIRPVGDTAGVFNEYYPGTGLDLAKVPQEIATKADGSVLVAPAVLNSFTSLDVTNDTDQAVWFELFYGWDDFRDNRLVFPSIQFRQVSHCVFDLYAKNPGGEIEVLVPDLSGTVITDGDGVEWFAVARLLLIVWSADSNDYTFVANTDGSETHGICQPSTTIQIPAGGDFAVHKGDGVETVNGVVSEIYQCLPIP